MRVHIDDAPDVVVINTCSTSPTRRCQMSKRRSQSIKATRTPLSWSSIVTPNEAMKSRTLRSRPRVGCGKIQPVAHLEGQKREHALAIAGEIKEVRDFIPVSRAESGRTFLKVGDGCNYFCAFCTIPLARGRSRSANVATPWRKRGTVAEGAKEIVLTGVNIGTWRSPAKRCWIWCVTRCARRVERFRISSIEPNLLTDEIIDFISTSAKFQPHFHIPLQSGSNEVLSAMRRRYRTALYASRIQRIRERMPHASIGVDVIVGFPGESSEHFLTTVNFIKSLEISYLHVFTYSESLAALRIGDVVPCQTEKTQQNPTQREPESTTCPLRDLLGIRIPRLV